MTVNCIAAGGQGSEERRERACQSGDARERAVRDCLIRTTGFGSGPRVALAGLGPSPRARVGASVFGSAPSPALSFICGSRHAHHLWRGATYGARALPATRPLAAAPRALPATPRTTNRPPFRPRPSPASTAVRAEISFNRCLIFTSPTTQNEGSASSSSGF